MSNDPNYDQRSSETTHDPNDIAYYATQSTTNAPSNSTNSVTLAPDITTTTESKFVTIPPTGFLDLGDELGTAVLVALITIGVIAFIMMMTWCFFPAVFGKKYKRGIVDRRDNIWPRRDFDLFASVDEADLSVLIKLYPATFMHFVCCYTLRVADTFSASHLGQFWVQVVAIAICGPCVPCYLPLMRSSVRDFLNGPMCTMADLLVALVPCTHYFCCFGFREAIAVDEATRVLPRFIFRLQREDDEEPIPEWSPPHWLGRSYPWRCFLFMARWWNSAREQKKKRPGRHVVGDSIKIRDTTQYANEDDMHRAMEAGLAQFRAAQMMDTGGVLDFDQTYDSMGRTAPHESKKVSKHSEVRPDSRQSSTFDDFPEIKNMGHTAQINYIVGKRKSAKPLSRPRCFEFQENGSCKLGARCWWSHDRPSQNINTSDNLMLNKKIKTHHISPEDSYVSNAQQESDEKIEKTINCPGEHGLVLVPDEPPWVPLGTSTRDGIAALQTGALANRQCNICQYQIERKCYVCTICVWIVCDSCAKQHRDTILEPIN